MKRRRMRMRQEQMKNELAKEVESSEVLVENVVLPPKEPENLKEEELDDVVFLESTEEVLKRKKMEEEARVAAEKLKNEMRMKTVKPAKDGKLLKKSKKSRLMGPGKNKND